MILYNSFLWVDILPGAAARFPKIQCKGAKNLKYQDFRVKRYEYINFSSFFFLILFLLLVHYIRQTFFYLNVFTLLDFSFLLFYITPTATTTNQFVFYSLFAVVYTYIYCLLAFLQFYQLKIWVWEFCVNGWVCKSSAKHLHEIFANTAGNSPQLLAHSIVF